MLYPIILDEIGHMTSCYKSISRNLELQEIGIQKRQFSRSHKNIIENRTSHTWSKNKQSQKTKTSYVLFETKLLPEFPECNRHKNKDD